MTLWAIEGNTLKLDGGAMFGNAPKALWKRWMEPDEENRITLASRCLLWKREDGKKILFECGVGDFFEPKLKERYGIEPGRNKLIEGLNAIGFSEEEIDAVVLSHLHFDHAGGLLTQDGKGLLFKNAIYYVGKKHFEVAKHPPLREQASFIPMLTTLLQNSSHLQHEIPNLFFESSGHTEGLTLCHIGPFVYAADLIPGLPWLRLPITMGYDRFSEKIVEEKRDFLERIEKEKRWVFFTHDPLCIACTVKKEGEGFAIDKRIDNDPLSSWQRLDTFFDFS